MGALVTKESYWKNSGGIDGETVDTRPTLARRKSVGAKRAIDRALRGHSNRKRSRTLFRFGISGWELCVLGKVGGVAGAWVAGDCAVGSGGCDGWPCWAKAADIANTSARIESKLMRFIVTSRTSLQAACNL